MIQMVSVCLWSLQKALEIWDINDLILPPGDGQVGKLYGIKYLSVIAIYLDKVDAPGIYIYKYLKGTFNIPFTYFQKIAMILIDVIGQ